MKIIRNSIETMAGPSEWFTGAAYVDPNRTDDEYGAAPATEGA